MRINNGKQNESRRLIGFNRRRGINPEGVRSLKGFFIAALLSLLFLSCADPLKGKSPYWYNGYVYGTQGFSYFAQGRLDAAIASYKKACAESQRVDIPQQSAQYAFNIGRCYFELGQTDSALGFFRQAYDGFVYCNDMPDGASAAAFSALAYSDKGEHDSAMAWYKKSTAREADKQQRPFMLFVHGRLLWSRDHAREALTYFEEAQILYARQKDLNAVARMCRFRAEIYKTLSDYGEAAKCIEEALAYSDKAELRFDRFRIVLAAASLSACAGDSAKAWWYYRRAQQCTPSAIRLPSMDFIKDCKNPWQ